jgi:hypothetical protein
MTALYLLADEYRTDLAKLAELKRDMKANIARGSDDV